MFIREYVPKRLLAWVARAVYWVARAVYNGPYVAAPMSSTFDASDERWIVEPRLITDGHESWLRVELEPTPRTPGSHSKDHFFKEHSWGYGQTPSGQLLEYQVWHPVWETLPVRDFALSWDWAAV